jgi:hypothetical protein
MGHFKDDNKPHVLPECIEQDAAPLAPAVGCRNYTIRRVVQNVPGLGAYVA